MSALGVFDNSCKSLTKMLKDLDVEVSIQRRLLSKIMNIAIRSTYFTLSSKTELTEKYSFHFKVVTFLVSSLQNGQLI